VELHRGGTSLQVDHSLPEAVTEEKLLDSRKDLWKITEALCA